MPNGEDAVPLLLDTHCWVWFEFGLSHEFSRQGRAALDRAIAQRRLILSVISVWELGMLEPKGRIELDVEAAQWVERALATPGLVLAPLTPEIALDASRLPGELHGDPADRIIVATARRLGARLLSRDRRLLDYGRKGHVRVLRA